VSSCNLLFIKHLPEFDLIPMRHRCCGPVCGNL
jgi:hypothetical protein